MNQLFIGIIIVLGLGGYFLYSQNVTLKENAIITQNDIDQVGGY